MTKFQNSWQCKEFTSDKRNLFGLLDLGQSREKIDRPSFPMERKNFSNSYFVKSIHSDVACVKSRYLLTVQFFVTCILEHVLCRSGWSSFSEVKHLSDLTTPIVYEHKSTTSDPCRM